MSDVQAMSVMQQTDAATNRMRTATRILKKGKALHLVRAPRRELPGGAGTGEGEDDSPSAPPRRRVPQDDFSAPLTLLIDQFASERSAHRRILHPLMQSVLEKEDGDAAASTSHAGQQGAGQGSPGRRRKKKRTLKHQVAQQPALAARGAGLPVMRPIERAAERQQGAQSGTSDRRPHRLPPLETSPNGPELRRQHRRNEVSSGAAVVDSWPATVKHHPALYTHLETYIKTELSGEDEAFSERRLQVMRNVFSEFCDSFKVYSPLLHAVKSEYERALEHERRERKQEVEALMGRISALERAANPTLDDRSG